MDGEPSSNLITLPAFSPGLFPIMPAATYHAIEAMSASGAKKMLRSPLHYKLMRDTPNEPTAQMEFGTVVHAGVLEPDTLDDIVAVAPAVNARTNAGKALLAEFAELNAGRIILSPSDAVRAQRCIAAVRAHPGAMKLLDGGERELSLFWQDSRFSVPAKARYDAFNHGGVIDLKTCQNASPEDFAKTIAAFDYMTQAAFYISGAEHVLNASPRFFCFIAVETEPPHAVATYALGSASILAGQHRVDIALERYAVALARGVWEGYPSTIETIEIPMWARRFPA